MTDTSPIIRFADVCKTYVDDNGEGHEALRHIDLEINEGEMFGIIGLSGAGKSTLVRCINGIERPTSGSVVVDGNDIASLSSGALRELRTHIGMIFQSFNLMHSRTVAGNVELALINSKLSRDERKARVRELLELVELSDKADQYPSELSGGQQQRVAIARALANRPRILLSDEGTSALDPLTTRSILALLKKLNETLGITVVIIAHQLTVIQDTCTRVAVMSNGEVVEQQSVEGIFMNPQADITKQLVTAASNLSKVDDILQGRDSGFTLHDDEILAVCKYVARSVSEPLVSLASRRFGVDINILFADVSRLRESAIGGIVITIRGDKRQRDAVLDYFRQDGILVEVLR
ncbi:methionine ABC transporter ATP-binding protein [Bifidobacterium amazonense]|uniref:Methionine ABC transporter ATP-binding protein n=1 Tax=Bifidobacterium amazonense TaxID=2809027 RepID=A0ABS9VS49_9BIFI|nr:methionine ABC transporter ATP-binding protein [Bifidobacterium amazonense]MCH9274907.1 methionine ABC transporter ATP-binding protein [Bifidobacterium amazonense]